MLKVASRPVSTHCREKPAEAWRGTGEAQGEPAAGGAQEQNQQVGNLRNKHQQNQENVSLYSLQPYSRPRLGLLHSQPPGAAHMVAAY